MYKQYVVVQNEPGYIYLIYFGVTETLAKLQTLCATHCVISVLCIMIKLFMFLSIDLLKKSVVMNKIAK